MADYYDKLLCNFGIPTSRQVLFDNRNKSYSEFIQQLRNDYLYESGIDVNIGQFEQMEYPQNQLKISTFKMDDKDDEIYTFYTIKSNDGFTAGKLLYEIAKALPEIDENEDNSDAYYVAQLSWDAPTESYVIYGDY